ncbi:MAG: hypothetical protein LC772_06595 [Chloroflexi bacterium]|nr:hypothetical protein [Chloroflexota bacterium]
MNIIIHNFSDDSRRTYIDPERNTHEFDFREEAEAICRKLSRRYDMVTLESGGHVLEEFIRESARRD